VLYVANWPNPGTQADLWGVMNPRDFSHNFHALTGNCPFPWQEALYRRFLDNTVERALDIPTGLGKTAVMAVWLLARAGEASIPRRLVYIVYRRAVVDQATDVASALREAIARRPDLGAALKLNGRQLPISTLRGQHVDNKQWLEDPSSPAIIVGTIDMIGSRLLFEGYGISRKMRPYHAGLLGADTLVVLDEAHLVPPFEMLLDAIVSNSAGVAPREVEARKVIPRFQLMALSATGRTRSEKPFSLTDADLNHPIVAQRLTAKKRLRLKLMKGTDDLTPGKLDEVLAKKLARMAWVIAGRGKKAVRVIVYCDKRKIAEATKQALEKRARKENQTDIKDRTELFVGGRRVYEREAAAASLRNLGFIAGSNVTLTRAVFLFATSAAEVGVDLDADHMVSDLVEWERMIQRLGRVNRRGEGDAQVVVLVEPDPKPDKAATTAMAKEPSNRNEKDTKALDAYQRNVELDRAKRKPFDHLLKYDDGTINASPAAIRALKGQADSDEALCGILDAATTAELLRPALTRPVVDAWSMTSLEEHTGRPEIGPWLRGWVDDSPQTAVVWRTNLPIRNQGNVTKKEIEAFFEAAPPHTSEVLETETDSVLSWLKKRAAQILKQQKELLDGFEQGRPMGFVLSSAGDLRGIFCLGAGDLEYVLASKRAKKGDDADKKALWNATLIVDARVAGLREGLLDAACHESPRTADDDQAWMPPVDGQPVIKFRIRSTNADTTGEVIGASQWRTRLRFPTTLSEEGEAVGCLLIEKWRSDSAIEEDRSLGRCQLLEDHQALAEKRARELAKRLSLASQYEEMLAIAARLHDEGKRAIRWQRAFNAPDDGNLYAKTPGPINFALLDGYRHEFASIEVAAKDSGLLNLPEYLRELALHLITAHHGYGRPLIGVSGCEDAPPSKLEARAREVALRFARLQQRWGPWGLAWWESLLRAVDHQASRENDTANIGTGS